MSYILIIYYSRYGAVAEMAQHVARGIAEIKGIEARVRQVPEVTSVCTPPSSELIPAKGPPYASLADVQNCAGLILGSPGYFGNMSAALKHFIDNLTTLWITASLKDKPAAVFTSTGSLHWGQETTLISMMLPLLHHGTLLIGLPATESDLFTTKTGGTPYGPSHLAGMKGENEVNEAEKRLCRALGRRVAEIALKLQG